MPEKPQAPWVTLALIAVCLAFAVVLVVDPNIAVEAGFRARQPSAGAALASLFLHQNVWHLLGNLVFLASVGPLLEYSSGKWRMLAAFFISGLCGVLGFWAMSQGSNQVLIGASGSVAGLIGYASVRHLNLRVPVLPGLPVPAWAMAALWAGLQLLGGLWRLGEEGGGVSYWAHAAGFLAGLACAAAFGAGRQMNQEIGHEVLDRMNERGPAASLHAAEKHLLAHPGDRKALRQKADALHSLGEDLLASQVLLELMAVSGEESQPVVLREVSVLGGLAAIHPLERAKLAERWRDKDPKLAQLLLESLVAQPDDEPQRPDAILKLAELVKPQDASRAAALLDELSAKYSGHGAAAVAKAKGLLT